MDYIEGATLSKKGGGKLEDPRPKELYSRFPTTNVSAQSTAVADPMGGERLRGEDSSKASSSCPVYKCKARNDKYLIFRVNLN